MMGFLFVLVFLALCQFLTPFWGWVLVVPFIWSLMQSRSFRSAFWTGFAGAGILWLGMSLFLWAGSARLIADRVAVLLSINSAVLLVLITALFAAVTAGFAGGTGYLLRTALFPQRDS